jgi:hypothetical protein
MPLLQPPAGRLRGSAQIIAEHELVHVKHTWENLSGYDEPSAKTYVPVLMLGLWGGVDFVDRC